MIYLKGLFMTTTKDCSFIQFYTPSRYDQYVDLGNGFSDTLDFCKNKGEVFWLEHKGLVWASTYKILNKKADLENFKNEKLPVKTKTIFISAIYITHLYQSYIWAKENPEIQFIVGGPAVISNLFILTEQLPPNLKLTEKSVEEFFGIEDFSNNWKIDIPIQFKEVVFSYTVDTSCYWGKCIYCNFTFCKRRIRKKFNFEFKDIIWDGNKIIRINTSATTNTQIKNILPALPRLEKTRYDFYLRFGKQELNSLKYIQKSCADLNLKILTGIEFPSDKMLSFFNKGITVKEIFDILPILEKQSNLIATLFIILGWEELENDDLVQLQKFIKHLPKNCKVAITRIFARPFTKLFEMYEREVEQQIGPFYLGFVPKLSKEKLKLNYEAKDIIFQHQNVVDFTKGLL
jgi:hypothetical protein